ncbi:metallophosphoesterase [Gordonia caeni]|uniref:Metallophosphoesterase n=1 Tax=Gordonia caeni TaxID=1007097 RepID=A0ABP7PFB6_9ACTN
MYWIIAVVAVLIVAAITYWLHRRLVVATGLRGGWSVAANTILVAGSLAGVSAFLVGAGVLDPAWARPLGWIGYTWWAVLFYLILGVTLIGIISLIQRAVGRLRSARRGTAPPVRPQRWLQIATAVLVIAAPVIVGYGVFEANRPQVTQDTVTVPRLPAQFAGLRIAVVTDLHVGPARGAGYTQRVVDLVNAEHPDVVILGGDLADGTVAQVGGDLEPLRDLRAPLGVFGVSGNHEYIADDGGSWLDFWSTLGVRPLRNERVELHRDGAVIDLAGVYDATAPEPYRPDPGKALDGRDRDRVLLYAAHQPKQAEEVQGQGVDLQVSGHTHGGQLWPFGYAVGLQQPVVTGFGQVGDVEVFVSRGAGSWGPPVRVGAPPQIALLTLQP